MKHPERDGLGAAIRTLQELRSQLDDLDVPRDNVHLRDYAVECMFNATDYLITLSERQKGPRETP